MTRAILYARVSRDDSRSEGRNIAGQLEMGRDYAAAHGYTVVAELAEDETGASGATVDLPALNQLREMARGRLADVIIVREMDRLARGLAKQLLLEQELRASGVAIEYVLGDYPDTPEGGLMKNVRAVIAEYERLKTGERTARGRILSVKAGNVIVAGNPPFGYRIERGENYRTLVIDPEEAAVIRQIFDWYVNGWPGQAYVSTNDIALKLTEMRVLTSTDRGRNIARKVRPPGTWGRYTIRHILKNPTYKGQWRYKSAQGVVTVEVPVIIEPDLWERARQRRRAMTHYNRRNTKAQYLMRRRVVCECGYKHHVRRVRVSKPSGKTYEHRYYTCNGKKKGDRLERCKLPSFPANEVDAGVWRQIRSILEDPRHIERLTATYAAQQEQHRAPLIARLAAIDKELENTRAQVERLIDLALEGVFTREVILTRQDQIETVMLALQQERQQVTDQLSTPVPLDDLKDLAGKIRQGLDTADRDFAKRRWIIDKLEAMLTVFIAEDGTKQGRLTLMGVPVGIVVFA